MASTAVVSSTAEPSSTRATSVSHPPETHSVNWPTARGPSTMTRAAGLGVSLPRCSWDGEARHLPCRQSGGHERYTPHLISTERAAGPPLECFMAVADLVTSRHSLRAATAVGLLLPEGTLFGGPAIRQWAQRPYAREMLEVSMRHCARGTERSRWFHRWN